MPTVNKITRPWMKPAAKPTSRWGGKTHADVPNQFYRNAPWRTVRRLQLQQYPLCAQCLKESPKRLVEATVVDHIKPIRLGGEPLDMDNLMSLCKSCHARKSGRERHINKE